MLIIRTIFVYIQKVRLINMNSWVSYSEMKVLLLNSHD